MEWLSKLSQPAKTAGRHLLMCLPLWLLIVVDLSAGVLVAPTAVFLSEMDRTGRMMVQNPSDSPKEITVYLSFGIPESDSLGEVSVRLIDSAITDPRSAVEWIRVFPRKLTLAPHDKQTIRFIARPPKGLPDGEYWARIVVRSEEGAAAIPSATESDGITTTINMVMQTAISLKYRTGNLISKIEVVDTRIETHESQIDALIDMTNRGNVSYLGLLKTRLVDADRVEIVSRQMDLAVYRNLLRRVSLPLPEDGGFKKPYRLEVSITSEGRRDIQSELIVPGNKIDYSMVID